VYFQGYHGDCSETFAAGQVDDEGMRLLQVKRNNIPERRIVHRV
jgi:methionine aminopeptidase